MIKNDQRLSWDLNCPQASSLDKTERQFTYTALASGPFQAILRFPHLPNSRRRFENETQMENRIKNIVKIKLYAFATEYNGQNFRRLSIVAVGIGLLGCAFFLKK